MTTVPLESHRLGVKPGDRVRITRLRGVDGLWFAVGLEPRISFHGPIRGQPEDRVDVIAGPDLVTKGVVRRLPLCGWTVRVAETVDPQPDSYEILDPDNLPDDWLAAVAQRALVGTNSNN